MPNLQGPSRFKRSGRFSDAGFSTVVVRFCWAPEWPGCGKEGDKNVLTPPMAIKLLWALPFYVQVCSLKGQVLSLFFVMVLCQMLI